MTIGTAIVASTNVRRTVGIGVSQTLRVTLSTVRVANTQSQIISASWWRGGEAVSGLIGEAFRPLVRSSRGRAGALGGGDVGVHEFGVDGDRRGGAFAGGRDDLRARVGGVSRRPDAGHAGAAVRTGVYEPVRA